MNNNENQKKKILFITPDLSLNGANVVLIELMDILKQYDIEMHMLASADGDLSKDLGAEAKIEICSTVRTDKAFRQHLQKDFDIIFLNTSSVHYYALFFMNLQIPVYWWFHESRPQLEMTQKDMIHLGLLSENFHILAVTQRVKTGLKKLYGCEAEILHMPVKEPETEDKILKQMSAQDGRAMQYEMKSLDENDKTVFFMPGAYVYIKGQDLVLKAIIELPTAYLERAEFVFAGYRLDSQNEYYQTIKSAAEKIPNVKILDQLSRDEIYEYYTSCDCVLAPSRIDSTPTTVVEAMMHHKLCIVSTGAGIADYMQDCVNGFVFENENIEEFRKRILFVISEHNTLGKLAEKGYEIYKENFSPEAVEKKIREIMPEVTG